MMSNKFKLGLVNFLLILLSILACPIAYAVDTSIQSVVNPTSTQAQATHAAITIDPVLQFAQQRIQDIKKLIGGPNGRPAPVIAPYQSCQQLYARRLQLLPQTLDYKPAYWDDPRNRVAVFLGTMFAPAFYFLSYTGISSYLDAARQIDPRIELDALRHASAQQRCFIN